jgi:AraC family transcriptional regulator
MFDYDYRVHKKSDNKIKTGLIYREGVKMNILMMMNEVIEYVEEHLESEIDCEEITKISGYSWFYLQKLFTGIAGITLAEYVRRRRMTVAASEVMNSGIRVLDLAMKYGYESADSFSRAFRNVHGVSPSDARKEKGALKTYQPMSFVISVKGEKEITYRIESHDEMRIVGIIRHFKAPENNELDVNVFWNQLYSDGSHGRIADLADGDIQGVHGFIHVINNETVDYVIAAFSEQEVPEGMEVYTVPKSKWAIFEGTGYVGIAIEELWRRIYSEWLPSTKYIHTETMEIECFQYGDNKMDEDYRFEIWIPVTNN